MTKTHTTLTFTFAEIRKIYLTTINASEHRPIYGEETGPALWLVKDDGIYLMSNAALAKGTKPTVAYAQGYNPKKADVWDECRWAMGGDDGAHPLVISESANFWNKLEKVNCGKVHEGDVFSVIIGTEDDDDGHAYYFPVSIRFSPRLRKVTI